MVYIGQSTGIFVGVERIVGSIGERTGSFVLKSQGMFATDTLEAKWSVVPGSGLRGSPRFRVPARTVGKKSRISEHYSRSNTISIERRLKAPLTT
ncbi:MAG: DUF3224 domain-containing protein [Acidobacteriaceae bacterium]|nr:DUF3224 domain-containing protein [Acidobacteriaceae bacterium]